MHKQADHAIGPGTGGVEQRRIANEDIARLLCLVRLCRTDHQEREPEP
jgi:hypothetical protein